MVSSNEADFDLRETPPLPRNILQDLGLSQGYTGQRMSPRILPCSKGYRSWLLVSTSLKVSASHLTYLADMRDSAKSGLGHRDNRHLNYLVESIVVNVGGSCQDANVSSLRMPDKSVGGSIVVGGRENRSQGEGSQKFDIPLYPVAASPVNAGRTGSTAGCEREQDDNAESNLSSGTPNFGEPDAVKVARPVRRGECGNVH